MAIDTDNVDGERNSGDRATRLNTRARSFTSAAGVKFLLLMDLFAVPVSTVNIYLSGWMLALRQVLPGSSVVQQRDDQRVPETEEDRLRLVTKRTGEGRRRGSRGHGKRQDRK